MRVGLSFVAAALLVSILSSCATLSEGGRRVKIVDPSELTEVKAKCAYKGELSGTGESEDEATGVSLATIDLRNRAAEMRANIVVSRLRPHKTVGMLAASNTVKGQGFFCPPAVAEKLMNAESM